MSHDITLVMTVLDEADSLPSLLRSIENQSVLPHEIVVVDGGSTDATVSLLQQWASRTSVPVRVLSRPGANISRGRNVAIGASATPFVGVADAGTTLSEDWLRDLLATLRGGADVAAGFFEARGDSFLERLIASTITPHVSEIDPDSFLPSSRSLAVRKSAWSAAGGYPEWLDYCEDLVFDLKMLADGQTFVFVPTAVATWNARASLPAFARQYFRYARGDGKADLWRKRHAIRYGAYAVGIALASQARGSRSARRLLALGATLYMQKFWRRVWRTRFDCGIEILPMLALVPVVVITGDVAKMAGYPIGAAWRRQGRAPERRSGWPTPDARSTTASRT